MERSQRSRQTDIYGSHAGAIAIFAGNLSPDANLPGRPVPIIVETPMSSLSERATGERDPLDAAKLIDKLFPRGTGGGADGEAWLIVGLGNPGPKYKDTRHNVAWWALDVLAERAGAKFGKRSGDAETAEAQISDGVAMLVRPMTYVNLSGRAVRAAMRKRNIPAERVIVISDDINLEPGRIRIRKKGGAGGHNGLKSVIDSLGTNEFGRIRIGVGMPATPDEQVNYVLGKMPPKERELVREAANRAADAVEAAVRDGLDESMNRFNG